MNFFSPVLRLLAAAALFAAGAVLPAAGQTASPAPDYTQVPASRDGIGKVYMGREIAQVMGHQGAGWLDRSSRVGEERTDQLMDDLRRRLAPDAVVADIGAGSGYFTFLLAPLVPRGRVIAEDIDADMLKIVERKKAATHAANVETVLGTTTDPKLPPGGVDAVLLVDTYHEWDHPYEMMTAVLRELKPGGRVYQVEYRGEDSTVQILPHHKMTVAQARKEMEAAGLHWLETVDDLPQQHVIVYEKK